MALSRCQSSRARSSRRCADCRQFDWCRCQLPAHHVPRRCSCPSSPLPHRCIPTYTSSQYQCDLSCEYSFQFQLSYQSKFSVSAFHFSVTVNLNHIAQYHHLSAAATEHFELAVALVTSFTTQYNDYFCGWNPKRTTYPLGLYVKLS